jgi:hypothetical protein
MAFVPCGSEISGSLIRTPMQPAVPMADLPTEPPRMPASTWDCQTAEPSLRGIECQNTPPGQCSLRVEPAPPLLARPRRGCCASAHRYAADRDRAALRLILGTVGRRMAELGRPAAARTRGAGPPACQGSATGIASAVLWPIARKTRRSLRAIGRAGRTGSCGQRNATLLRSTQVAGGAAAGKCARGGIDRPAGVGRARSRLVVAAATRGKPHRKHCARDGKDSDPCASRCAAESLHARMLDGRAWGCNGF